MQKTRTWKRVSAVMLTIAMLVGMLSMLGGLTTSAATTEAMKFKADFSELSAIAENAGAYGEGTYYRPGYTTTADKAIMAWVDEKFDMWGGYGKSLVRTYLGQSSSTMATAKDTWSAENYWTLHNDGSVKLNTKNSGQMFRHIEKFVPKANGEAAVLANFEAKVTLAVTEHGGQGHGFIVAFHMAKAGLINSSGDHNMVATYGSFVALGNGRGSYTTPDGYGVAVFDQNNTLGTDGACVRAAAASVIPNTNFNNGKSTYTAGSADEIANANVDGELLAEDNDLQLGTKYDLTVKVVGKNVTITVANNATGDVLYTRETTLNQAGSGYMAIGAANGPDKIYNVEIQELDENGKPVDFGTRTGKDEIETLKVDFADVPEVQWYNGKYYYNAGYDTSDVTATVDMSTDWLAAESTTHVINTQEKMLVDYLESKLAFYYQQESNYFERPNVNGYVVDSTGVEFTGKASANGTVYAPDRNVLAGDGIDGVGPQWNSGNGIGKWYLDSNKWLGYTYRNGDHAFRNSSNIALKDKNGELLQMDDFQLDMDFKMYADGTYDYNFLTVGFRSSSPSLIRNGTALAAFALSPYGGYLLGDDLVTEQGSGYIFNKAGTGTATNTSYDPYTAETCTTASVPLTYQTATNVNTETRSMIWPEAMDSGIGNNVEAHLTLKVVGNTATVKVTDTSGAVLLEDTATLTTRTGAGYLLIGGSNRAGWFANIEVTRLDKNGNPVDFTDDGEGWTFGESFDAVARAYAGTYFRNTDKDVFWLEGSNASEYTFDAPATYTDDADTVAHLKEKFGLYAYFGGGLFKLAEPYQTSEDSTDTDDTWTSIGGAANYARWYYTDVGFTMRTGNNTASGGEALRKGMALSPKVNGELIYTRNVEVSTDIVLTSNSNNYSLVNVSLRTAEEGRFINGNKDANNTYADHIALQVRPDGINIVDGTKLFEETANITASAGYTAYSDGAKHYNLRVYAKVVNDKLTVKVADLQTGATLFEVTDKAVSYTKKGYVVVSTGQAKASIANVYVNVLDGNGDQIDVDEQTDATERLYDTFSTNYSGFFAYNSEGKADSRVPAVLRTAKNLQGKDFFGTWANGYSHRQILNDRATAYALPEFLVSAGYTLTEGVLADADGNFVASTAEPGITSIDLVENAEDATLNAYVITFDTDYLDQLVKDLSDELYDYLDGKFEFYYTDVDTYKGEARNNRWGYEPAAVYSNRYLQWSNSTASYENADAPVDKNISVLVPKDNDGAALYGANFSATVGARLTDAGTYGTAYFAFNMPTAGKMGGAEKSNEVITFDSDVNVIRVNTTSCQLWNGSEWIDIAEGYVGKNADTTLNINVTDGVLTGSVTVGTTSYPFTETTLVNTNAGYVAYGFNSKGVNMDKMSVTVKGEKKMAAAAETEGGNITVERATSDVAGMYKYVVTATADEGYELKANTLLGTDANGATVYPAQRVGFQSDVEGGDVFYFYSAEDITFDAEFYTAHTVADANMGNLGTSYHETSYGLRFISRIYARTDENDVRWIEIDGAKYELADYGMVLTTEAAINWGTTNGKGTELELNSTNPYIRSFSVMNANKHFDISANYIDISTRVVGLEDQQDMRVYSRAYIVVKLPDGSTEEVYAKTFNSTFSETAQLNDITYLDTVNGSDANKGDTQTAPVATLAYAMSRTKHGGEIVNLGTVTASSSTFGSKTPTKALTLSGGTYDLSGASAISLTSPLTFKDTILKVADGGRIYAAGYALTIEESVTVDGTLQYLFGGANGAYVETTSLTVEAGNYYNIYGGSNGADVGTTNVYVGGTVNADLRTEGESSHNVRIYGSSSGDGKTAVETNVTLAGGYTYMIYGGGTTATASETNVTVTGGEVAQVFGGNENCSMTGNTNVNILGGTISRRIYGGCYNEATRSGISITWAATNYHVTGNTTVTLSSNADVTCTGDTECGIFAISRNNTTFTDEVATLQYENAAAQSEFSGKVGPQGTLSGLIGIASPYYDSVVVLG